MASVAVAGSEEVRFARGRIASQQLFKWIIAWNAGAVQRHLCLIVQKCREVRNLRVVISERRHVFVDAAVLDNWSNQIPALVMIHQRRSDEIGPARAGGIVAVTKSASRFEQLPASVHGFVFRPLAKGR